VFFVASLFLVKVVQKIIEVGLNWQK